MAGLGVTLTLPLTRELSRPSGPHVKTLGAGLYNFRFLSFYESTVRMPELGASHASEMSITSLISSKAILLPPQGVHWACCSVFSLGAPLGKN